MDTAALRQQLACSVHIQYLEAFRTQYKAQLLHRDQDTVRDSLGCMCLDHSNTWTSIISILRKTRKDALFVEHHPDEIVFPLNWMAAITAEAAAIALQAVQRRFISTVRAGTLPRRTRPVRAGSVRARGSAPRQPTRTRGGGR